MTREELAKMKERTAKADEILKKIDHHKNVQKQLSDPSQVGKFSINFMTYGSDKWTTIHSSHMPPDDSIRKLLSNNLLEVVQRLEEEFNNL